MRLGAVVCMQAIIVYLQSERYGNESRRYQLIPVNDTELLSALTEMPLELDQLRVLCDLMAMEESVKLLSDSEAYHNINTIISEKVRELQLKVCR